MPIYTQSCTLTGRTRFNGRSCTRYGVALDAGVAGKSSDDASLTYYEKGCEYDDLTGCAFAARVLREKRVSRKDVKRVARLLKRAARGSNPYGVALAATNESARYFASTFSCDTVVDKLLEHGCTANLRARACALHGWGRRLGVCGKRDDARARSDYRIACEKGCPDGCVSLGLLYSRGEGGPKDKSRAVELYKKACEMGYSGGCNNLGVMFNNGEGGKQDKKEARRWYKKACEMGDETGCDNLKEK